MESEINMKRKIFLRCIIGVFLAGTLIIGVAEYMHRDISSGIVRLHIIANSDTDYDQRVKLKVRDGVIAAQEELFPDGVKKELTEEEKKKLIKTAQEIIRAEGADYGVALETGKFYFPTKEYENITLPAGDYDAVRLVLGEGKGENWWCVMYPPLCFTGSAVGKMDKGSEDILKESMGAYQYETITQNTIKVRPAFKLVEMWQKFKQKIG